MGRYVFAITSVPSASHKRSRHLILFSSSLVIIIIVHKRTEAQSRHLIVEQGLFRSRPRLDATINGLNSGLGRSTQLTASGPSALNLDSGGRVAALEDREASLLSELKGAPYIIHVLTTSTE
ncbi:hypothetical protein M422DRAFT_277330 [Sphaerobolus stellatus SS14]|uniref:Uncharacterized protein n=1 Tax=Sphaerobolus stellatus (strain SS14) TaxID=990650 RepID=A0A0C9U029_SPHS4|nr:hypothetical protein M422DRAFT_277330 [Sphaerobolus stellatus SS14]